MKTGAKQTRSFTLTLNFEFLNVHLNLYAVMARVGQVSRFECVSGLSVYPVEIRSVHNLSSSEDCSTDYCQPV